MNEKTERQLVELITADRLYIPVSSFDGKLKRKKDKLVEEISLPNGKYFGERVYARIDSEDTMKARGMKEGIELFAGKYPREGAILNGLIAEQRKIREVNLCFGMNPECRLTSEDYVSVMKDLGLGEVTARNLYPELMEVSRRLSRKRDEERSILVG